MLVCQYINPVKATGKSDTNPNEVLSARKSKTLDNANVAMVINAPYFLVLDKAIKTPPSI
ncbi:hypothetical protein GCM10009114_30850 [Aliiglaciecola litoralis]|uniref:Uncharacterized protein n=1 Tax=Aliiglaciecola litoralis TaxID=582857 RepID=A0ABN1LQD2_9ALTE